MKALEKLLISNIKTKINFTKAKVSDGFSGGFFILEKVAYMSRIEAIHCEWRSSIVLDGRHVGSPFYLGIDGNFY